MANLRSAYAQAQAAYLTETEGSPDVHITKKSGKVTAIAVDNVKAEGTQSDFGNAANELPFADKVPADLGNKPGTYTVTFNYDDNGSISSVTAKKKA